MGFSGGGVAIDNETLKENIAGSIYVDEGALQVTKQNGQQAVDILVLQADLALTLTDYDEAQVDAFTDADGTHDTVDIANTDSYYITADKVYANSQSGTNIKNVSVNTGSSGYNRYRTGSTLYYGFIKTYSFRDASASGATHTVSVKKNGVVVATKDVTTGAGATGTANFVVGDYSETFGIGDTWRVEVTGQTNSDSGFTTYTGTLFTMTAVSGGGNTTYEAIPTAEEKNIRVNLPSITPSATAIWVKYKNGSVGQVVTYDINDGSSTETDKPQLQKNTYSLAGNMVYANIQLPATDITQIEGYFFMWWP